MIVVALLASFIAGAITLYLSSRRGIEHFRKHGKPGCQHDGGVACLACMKIVFEPPCPAAEIRYSPSPAMPGHVRFAIAITKEFGPYVDMKEADALKFVDDVRRLLDLQAGPDGHTCAPHEHAVHESPVEMAARLP
jgi:hypothetical protein